MSITELCDSSRWQFLNETSFGSVYRGFDPVLGTGFGEDVTNVPGHGVDADEQLSCNLRIVPAQGNKCKHFFFSLSE